MPVSYKDIHGLGRTLRVENGWTGDGASIDTRTLKPGNVFFALPGSLSDGHAFVRTAFDKGASLAVVTESGLAQYEGDLANRPLLVVPDVLKALQELARTYRRKAELSVIGITGTNGKTTCKEMMLAVLMKEYTTLATPGNLNNEIGVPLTLLRIGADTQVAIVEMGADKPGDIAFLCDMAKPDSGVITNIGMAHLHNFKTIDAIARTKSELFEALHDDGVRFVNMDDEWIRPHAQRTKGLVTFGMSESAQYRATVLSEDALGCATVRIETPEHQIVEAHLPVPGRHHVSNALIAATVGFSLGIDPGPIKDGLENYVPLSNRMGIKRHRDLVILDDTYNANPESMRAALKTLASARPGGRRVAVLGDMLELGDLAVSAHDDIVRCAAAENLDRVFLIGPLMHEAGQALNGKPHMTPFTSKTELAAALKSFVKAGDVILIKGSRGMKMEELMQELLTQD